MKGSLYFYFGEYGTKMELKHFIADANEKPLDRIVSNGGMCGIFRKIACIGDSLSSGEFESMSDGKKGYHDYYDYSWGQYIARDAGCVVYNFSRGGMSAKYYEQFAREKNFYSNEYLAQAYVIALGVNDVSQIISGEIELGCVSDICTETPESNKTTFAGYYGKIISDYKKLQPKAKFFLVTCPRGEDDVKRSDLYDKHAQLIKDIAEFFDNCYVIDLRSFAPVYDKEFKRNFFLGGHLNAAGYRLTALMIESYIDYIIRNHPDDFKQIGFVGTEFYNETEKW